MAEHTLMRVTIEIDDPQDKHKTKIELSCARNEPLDEKGYVFRAIIDNGKVDEIWRPTPEDATGPVDTEATAQSLIAAASVLMNHAGAAQIMISPEQAVEMGVMPKPGKMVA